MDEQVEAARKLLRSGGRLVSRIHGQGGKYADGLHGGTMLWTHLFVRIKGRYAPKTMAQMLWGAYLVPPNQVDIACVKAYRQVKQRPAITVVWSGRAMQEMLKAVGWQTGKAKLDEQIRKYLRWQKYKEQAWEWAGNPYGKGVASPQDEGGNRRCGGAV